jgi:hypothetical protein
MSDKEIALQLTLKAIECKLIQPYTIAKEEIDAWSGVYSRVISEFYNCILEAIKSE